MNILTNREFKIYLIKALKSRKGIYTRLNNDELITRCPYCGDSKNPNDGHLYIRINPDDNYPIVYNCFKCPAQGMLKPESIELLLGADPFLQQSITNLNKTSDKITTNGAKALYDDVDPIEFDFELPDTFSRSHKIHYIERRLEHKFSTEDLFDMKIITSFREFLIKNRLSHINCKPEFAKILEKDYIGFLSKNGSHILFRDTTESHDLRWYKYPITSASYGQPVIYSLTQEIDLFTSDEITINLSEGILDCLSAAYNLHDDISNSINIAVCGKSYGRVIKYLLGMGFIGSNIIINIYSDNDKVKDEYGNDTNINTYDTSIDFYRKMYGRYTNLVKEFNVYYNTTYKDIGVPKKDIKLIRYKL